MTSPRTVLITGSGGFLGHHLCEILSESYLEWRVIGTFYSSPGAEASRFQEIPMDLQDEEQISAALKQFQPSVIVHTAANSSPLFCEQNPSDVLAINRPSLLLTLIRRWLPSAIFVLFSSDQVYSGIPPHDSYTEADQPTPINVSDLSKVAAEQLVVDSPQNSLIFRPSLIFGPSFVRPDGKKKHCFLDVLQEAADTGNRLSLFEDEWRNPIHVVDIAAVVGKTLEIACTNTQELEKVPMKLLFNLGGAAAYSRWEMGLTICGEKKENEECAHFDRCRQEDQVQQVRRPADLRMSSAKAEAYLGRALHDAVRLHLNTPST